MRQNFYGTDLDRIRSLWGSHDYDFVQEILESEQEDITDIIESRDDDPDGLASVEKALRDIVDGTAKAAKDDDGWIYVRVLDVMCAHIGKEILGPKHYLIGNWDGTPIETLIDAPALEGTGPPIPIPYTTDLGASFDHIDIKNIPGEIRRLDELPAEYEAREKRYYEREQQWLPRTLRKLFGGKIRPYNGFPDWDVVAEYRAILQEALDKNVSLIADAG